MFKPAAIALFAVPVLALAAPAQAGDAACIWNGLPADMRAAFDKAAAGADPDSAAGKLSSDAAVASAAACKVPSGFFDKAGAAFGGFTLQREAEIILASRYSPAQLDAAWRRMDTAQVAAATTMLDQTDSFDGVIPLGRALAQALKVPDTAPAGMRAAFLVYAKGRIARALGEAGY